MITFLGLIIAAVFSICDKLVPAEKVPRWTWLVLVLAAFIFSGWGAVREDKEGQARDAAIHALTKTVPDNSVELGQVSLALGRIEDDLAQLLYRKGPRTAQEPLAGVAIAPPRLFYVQIATGTSRDRLEPTLKNLERRFGSDTGAAILDPKPGSRLFTLVWGQHLDKAAAARRAKAADALGLPPSGQPAEIKQEN